MQIRFYGRLGEMLGREIALDVPAEKATIAQLRELLADRFPDASTELLYRSRACVADVVVSDSQPFQRSDTVEFFPPLSGG